MSDVGIALVALAILVGIVGVLIPAVPGAALVVGAVLVWSLEVGTATGWVVFAVAAGAVLLSQIAKYAVPGRRMRAGGVPRSTLLAGAVLGIVGFFVVPVVGLVLGFVLGVYAAERRRLRDPVRARVSTRAALRAVGLSILIELVGVLLAAAVWGLAVATTG